MPPTGPAAGIKIKKSEGVEWGGRGYSVENPQKGARQDFLGDDSKSRAGGFPLRIDVHLSGERCPQKKTI